MIVETLLFDCDNTLVRSEKLAFAACCALVNEILSEHAVCRRFTPAQLMHEYVGRTFGYMLNDLAQTYGFAVTADEYARLVKLEEDRVIERLAAKVKPCAGVNPVLDDVVGRYQLAVVSSSALRRVRVCLTAAHQDRYFLRRHVYSATTSLPKPKGKPAPDIYFHSLADLGAAAETSLAIEDSRSGGLAAAGAGIPFVGYTGSYAPSERPQVAAALHEAGAIYVIDHWKKFPGLLRRLQQVEGTVV